MAYPMTENGYNMYDMLSMMQKAIRRGDYQHAGFAARQLRKTFRKVMWNRLLVISAEDCFGIITKEIVALYEQDAEQKNDCNISRAVGLLCIAKKSRDACYFACNFVLATRCTNRIDVSEDEIDDAEKNITRAREARGWKADEPVQLSLFENKERTTLQTQMYSNAVKLRKAVSHIDMDMIGYQMDLMKHGDREFLWDVFESYAKNIFDGYGIDEIRGLRKADGIVNSKKQEKDEIFISKAAIVLCVIEHKKDLQIAGSHLIENDSLIDWDLAEVRSIDDCVLPNGKIPEWVYDCHTLRGKKMGKTDWDMTVTEQAALSPLQPCFFDEASWIYTYEDDYVHGRMDDAGMAPIREYAKTHLANPISPLPYE